MNVVCPNILASRYAQRKLSEELGIDPLVKGKFYDDSSCFSVVFPPCYCFKNYPPFTREYGDNQVMHNEHGGCPIHDKHEKPIMCSCPEDLPAEQYTGMFDALRFLSMTERMK